MKPNLTCQQPDFHPVAKTPDLHTCRQLGRAAVLALVVNALLPIGASAQSATNFNTGKITPKAAATKTPVTKTPATQPPDAGPDATVVAGPSRYVGEADLEAYVTSLASTFSIRTRDTDPFGQLQDPDAKPIVKPTIAKKARRVAPTQATPFSEIVQRIRVTGIKASEQLFFVGTRSFKKGDCFPIDFRGRAVNVEVSSVTSRRIDFRNLDNGEIASIKINFMPIGMTQGGTCDIPPKMVPDKPNAPLPLEIEPSANFNEPSQN